MSPDSSGNPFVKKKTKDCNVQQDTSFSELAKQIAPEKEANLLKNLCYRKK
jgi:hypothetical protein